MWSINRQGYSSSRGTYKTEFSETFGNFGHNPRSILPHEATAAQTQKNVLTIGTQKVTSHIPGYSGFIPNTDINPKATKHSEGENARNTIIKQNIVENQSIKLPGYQGHKTMSVSNDRGTLRPHCLGVQGERFN